jgi:hypothetical protein
MVIEAATHHNQYSQYNMSICIDINIISSAFNGPIFKPLSFITLLKSHKPQVILVEHEPIWRMRTTPYTEHAIQSTETRSIMDQEQV